MIDGVSTLDRAVQLASSGTCASINHIRQQLRREGYLDVVPALAGATINQHLVKLLRQPGGANTTDN